MWSAWQSPWALPLPWDNPWSISWAQPRAVPCAIPWHSPWTFLCTPWSAPWDSPWEHEMAHGWAAPLRICRSFVCFAADEGCPWWTSPDGQDCQRRNLSQLSRVNILYLHRVPFHDILLIFIAALWRNCRPFFALQPTRAAPVRQACQRRNPSQRSRANIF